MGDKSKIEWTDASWNPVTGCSRVSPGCDHCYAEALSLRHGWSPKPWLPENAAENVILHPERLEQPLTWKRPRMVFVNSMSDLFHEQIPDDYIEQVYRVMAEAHWHTFQVLTKRPRRAEEFLAALYDRSEDTLGSGYGRAAWEPLSNVWLGVSIESWRFNWRADVLRRCSAAVRFISAEPLIDTLYPTVEELPGHVHVGHRGLDLRDIDWLIVGGESGGQHGRPMQPEWAYQLRDGAIARRLTRRPTAFFFKQWGSYDEFGTYRGRSPKSGGRLLGGREWNEMPGQLVMV